LALAAVHDLRERRAPATADELERYEIDVLAGFVLVRAAAGLTDGSVRGDVSALRGHPRGYTTTALRSLFGWAKRHNLVFRNPTARVANPAVPYGLWQPLRPDELGHTVSAAVTPQARLYVAHAAVHAARPGQIRAVQLDDVGLARRRITIAERLRIDRQLDEALATGGDPLHLALVFGISEDTAIRYAADARALLQAPPNPGRKSADS
jgi:integrase